MIEALSAYDLAPVPFFFFFVIFFMLSVVALVSKFDATLVLKLLDRAGCFRSAPGEHFLV